MKYLIMPDSFKGTFSSREVAETIKNCILKESPDSSALAIPISDGGEGLVDCILSASGGERISLNVTGPNGKQVSSFYGRLHCGDTSGDIPANESASSGDTAVIEMAAAAGLTLAEPGSSPVSTTTYGVGELIRHAVRSGCRRIIIGLGGSATNDAGAGMAAALGTVFLNGKSESFIPVGGNLSEVCCIDTSETRKLLDGITIEAMCDIDNEMYGPNGAAFVFAPQKGAGPDQVRLLDYNLRAFAARIQQQLGLNVSGLDVSGLDNSGLDVSGLPQTRLEPADEKPLGTKTDRRCSAANPPLRGAGAAGAMGAGVAAFLGGRLVRGIDAILDLIGFDRLAMDADYIITGEGKLDQQSLGNKAAIGIARRARALGKPVIAIVGVNELGREESGRKELNNVGICQVFETSETGSRYGLAPDDYLDSLRLTAAEMAQSFCQEP